MRTLTTVTAGTFSRHPALRWRTLAAFPKWSLSPSAAPIRLSNNRRKSQPSMWSSGAAGSELEVAQATVAAQSQALLKLKEYRVMFAVSPRAWESLSANPHNTGAAETSQDGRK
eukprot:scaffold77894_cov62-Phaeocystis_antarctica.AAC.3